MKIIFWENLISHLRTPFHKSLINQNNKVILVVDKELTEDRKKLGWKTEIITDLEVIVKPSNEEVAQIITSNEDAIHFVAGINVYETGTKAIKYLIKNKIKFYTGSEQFKNSGLKGYLRFLKSKINYFRYNKHIKGIYAIGDEAVSWYKKLGYSPDKIHQWIYFSEFVDIELNKSVDPILLFVGELSDRKNIIYLVESFLSVKSKNAVLKIIGDGKYKNEIEEYSRHHSNIYYLGVMPTNKVRNEMSKSTILVLPSVFDGWGAVVNEALLTGNFCITSNKCGSKLLFKNNNFIGTTFDLQSKNSLTKILAKTIKESSRINAEHIKNWAILNLDSNKISSYFLDTLLYHEEEKIAKPKAPWL